MTVGAAAGAVQSGAGYQAVQGRYQKGRETIAQEKEFGKEFATRLRGGKHAPYDYLAKDGIISYNGVNFVCDAERNQLCLGDVSDMRKCMCVALEKGGTLVVNYDNLGDLSNAISMFSPEDQRRIMYAVSEHKLATKMQKEIDEDTSGIGESAEENLDEKAEE